MDKLTLSLSLLAPLLTLFSPFVSQMKNPNDTTTFTEMQKQKEAV
jgi:hypothetical protein